MSDCLFNVGDKVDTPVGCGTVMEKNPVGGKWILKVKLETGPTVPVACSQATPCQH